MFLKSLTYRVFYLSSLKNIIINLILISQNKVIKLFSLLIEQCLKNLSKFNSI